MNSKMIKINPKKEKLKRLANNTVDIINKGCYKIDNSCEVNVSVGDSYIYELIEEIDSPVLNHRKPSSLNVKFSKSTTYQTIMHYNKNYSNCKIITLNFASAKNPGGGFLSGSSAQEESLSRVSGLYKSLLPNKDFYERSRNNPNNGLYYNIAIYSKDVPFIRDCNNEEIFIEPIYSDVITCAAVNRGVSLNNGVSEEIIMKCMVNRIKTVVELFLKEADSSRKNVLILGAFGCGVFKNSPSIVTKAFNYVFNFYKDELDKLDLEINFSIPDDLNYYEFKRWI